MPRVALITGITGQDGSLLAELLLDEGYEVHGLVRRATHPRPAWVTDLLARCVCHQGDLLDADSVRDVVDRVAAAALERGGGRAEVYNLAAQSHVGYSFECPGLTWQTNYDGVIKLLRGLERRKDVAWRVCQASTSEMFGSTPPPQDETGAFRPVSPYGKSKLAAHDALRLYRKCGMFACSAIGFNHESERRGPDFVTSKVLRAARTLQHTRLGNLDALRDWGYAGDHVRAMWEMLQLDTPDDYVVATGASHSVREFAEKAFEAHGHRLTWDADPDDPDREAGFVRGRVVIRVDPALFRPVEVPSLRGDAAKLRSATGWRPRVQTLPDLVALMSPNLRDVT